jgi:hypothetical protein
MIFLYLHVLSRIVPSSTILYLFGKSGPDFYHLAQSCTILYLRVPSCTKPKMFCTCWYRLLPSCSNRVKLVLYQTKKSGTALYHLVPTCTNRGNLVLVGAGTYWYILVRTSLPVYVKEYRIPDERACLTYAASLSNRPLPTPENRRPTSPHQQTQVLLFPIIPGEKIANKVL